MFGLVFILNCSDILSFWENLRPWLFAQFQFVISRIGDHKWLIVSILDFLGLSLSLSHLRLLSRKTNTGGVWRSRQGQACCPWARVCEVCVSVPWLSQCPCLLSGKTSESPFVISVHTFSSRYRKYPRLSPTLCITRASEFISKLCFSEMTLSAEESTSTQAALCLEIHISSEWLSHFFSSTLRPWGTELTELGRNMLQNLFWNAVSPEQRAARRCASHSQTQTRETVTVLEMGGNMTILSLHGSHWPERPALWGPLRRFWRTWEEGEHGSRTAVELVACRQVGRACRPSDGHVRRAESPVFWAPICKRLRIWNRDTVKREEPSVKLGKGWLRAFWEERWKDLRGLKTKGCLAGDPSL